MRIDTLEDLYIEQLNDIYSANKQALVIAKELTHAASDKALVKALTAGVAGIQEGITVFAAIAEGHEESLEGAHCKGMQGLVREARAHALDKDFGENETKDAMIITQYQRLVHYAIAGYGCLVAFADRLELDQDLDVLRKCLDSSYSGDRTMTELATGGINRAAMG